MKTKVQVKDLRKGDQLSNCLIVGDPKPTVYLGRRDRMEVPVQFNGRSPQISIRCWGADTTVTVLNR